MPLPNEPSGDDAALAALMAGAAGEAMPDAPAPEPQTIEPETPPAVPEGPTVEGVTGEQPEAPAATPDTPESPEAKPDDQPNPEPEPEAPAPDEAVEAEVIALGLKEKSAARFRELSSQVAAAEPLRAELEKLGVTSVEHIQQLAADANRGLQLIDDIRSTGADAEEFGMALDWLSLRSRGRTGDRKAAEEAFEVIGQEYATLAKVLGKPVPGVYDPLEGHADLQEAVEAGDITLAFAHETANARNLRAFAEQGQAQRATQQAEQTKQTEAVNAGKLALTTLGNQLKAADPARYTHHEAALHAIVRDVAARFPNNPEAWAAQVELAYLRLPAPPPPKPAAGSPVRQSAPLTPDVVPNPADLDPFEAMMLGINGGR